MPAAARAMAMMTLEANMLMVIGLVVFCLLVRWWNGIGILCDDGVLEWMVCVDE